MDALAKEIGLKGASSYQRYESAGNYRRKEFLPFELAMRIGRVLDGNGIPPVTYADVIALAGIERVGDPVHTAAVANTSERQSIQILKHHLAAVEAGDIYAVMTDFSETSVVITPKNVLTGPDNIRGHFAELIETSTRATLTSKQSIEGNVAMVTWHQQSGDEDTVVAVDTLVFREGLIAALTTSNATKK